MPRFFRPTLETLEGRDLCDGAAAGVVGSVIAAQQQIAVQVSDTLETASPSSALDQEDVALAQEQQRLEERLGELDSAVAWSTGEGFEHRLAVSVNHQHLYDTAVTASGLLVGAYQDGSIEIRSLETGTLLRTLRTGIGRAQCLAVAAGTDMIYVSAGTGPTSAVIAFNAVTGQELWRKTCGDYTNKISVSPDGTRVVVDVDNIGSLGFNAQTGAPLGSQTPSNSYGGLALADGRTLYFSQQNRSDVFVREANGSTRQLTSLPNLRYAGSVAPDGVTVAIAGGSTVRILHTQTGAIRDLAMGTTVTEVRFLSDGSLAVGRQDGVLEVWSADGATRTQAGQANAYIRSIRENGTSIVAQTSEDSPVWLAATKPSVTAERTSLQSRITQITLRKSAIEGERTALAAEAAAQEAARTAVFVEGFEEGEEFNSILSGIATDDTAENEPEAAFVVDAAALQRELLRQARLEHLPDMLRLEAARAIPLLEQAIASTQQSLDAANADVLAVQSTLQRLEAEKATWMAHRWSAINVPGYPVSAQTVDVKVRTLDPQINGAQEALSMAQGRVRDLTETLTQYQLLRQAALHNFSSTDPDTEDISTLSVVGFNANQLVVETSTPLDGVRVEIFRSDADGMRWQGETMRVFAGSPSEQTGTSTLVIPFHNGLHGGRYAVRLVNSDDQQIDQLFVGWSPERNTVTLGVDSFPSLARLTIPEDDASPSPAVDDRQAVIVAADARVMSLAPTLARSVADYAAITLVHRERVWDMLQLVDAATIETIKRELARQYAPIPIIGSSTEDDARLRAAYIETRVAAGFPRSQVESSVSVTATEVWNEAHKQVFQWIEDQKVATAAYVEFLAQLRIGRLTTFNPASLNPGHRLLPSGFQIEQAVAANFLELAGLRDIANHDAAQMIDRQELLSVSGAEQARRERIEASEAQRAAAAVNPALALQTGLQSAAPDAKQFQSDLAFLRRVLPLTAGDSIQTQKLLAGRPHAAAILIEEMRGESDMTSRAIRTAWDMLQGTAVVAEAGESDSALQERVLGGRISVTSIPSSLLSSDTPYSFELAPGNIQQFTFTVDAEQFLNVGIANLPYATTVWLLGAEGRVIHTSTRGAREGATISASIPAGTYTVSIEVAEAAYPEGQGQIGPVARGYDLTLTASPLSRTRIEGVISREGSGEVMPVSLSVAEFVGDKRNTEYVSSPETGGVHQLDPARPVWVVVHGMDDNERSGALLSVARELAMRPGLQVVMVDWEQAAGAILKSGNDAPWTRAVGEWVASQLLSLGFDPDNINMVGHSHGTYVAHAAAQKVMQMASGKQLNAIVALDPAGNVTAVSGFDESSIDFRAVSRNSVAIEGSWIAGSNRLASTADVSFQIDSASTHTPFTEHGLPVTTFANLLRSDRLLPGQQPDALRLTSIMRSAQDQPLPLEEDRFRSSYEGVITVDVATSPDGEYLVGLPRQIQYHNSGDPVDTIRTILDPNATIR